MKDLLFADQRIHPFLYDVQVQGQWERTVSIRGGIAWPSTDNPGYYLLIGQLEKKDRDNNERFLAFYEDHAPLTSEFFNKI